MDQAGQGAEYDRLPTQQARLALAGLFSEFVAPDKLPNGMQPIQWRNYYDYGDPVAYNLRSTRRWMAHHRWMPFFNFKEPKDEQTSAKRPPGTPPGTSPGSSPDEFGGDIGFSRYFFPGAAHNDYWRDPDVFGHFLQTVVDPTGQILPPMSQKRFSPPVTIKLAWVSNYTLPYLLWRVCSFFGVYVMYKALRACLDPVGTALESAGRDRPECPRALRHPGGDDPHRTHSAPDQEAKATPLGAAGTGGLVHVHNSCLSRKPSQHRDVSRGRLYH